MKLKGNRKSKRTKLSLKYNIQKRVRENKRRMKKQAKKLGVKKEKKKDIGIPNSWPFKAEMLAQVERQKEEHEKDIARRRAEAKKNAKHDQKKREAQSRKIQQEREADRREKRKALAEQRHSETLRRVLSRDVLLVALDARDPLGCRCAALEAWAQEKGKRLIFVLTKADLIAPELAVEWLKVLGSIGPVAVVAAEAGRQGIGELLQMLGRSPAAPSAAASSAAPAPAAATGSLVAPVGTVGIVGYPSTGKKALCKALRRELQGLPAWLLETPGKLSPPEGPLDAATALHLAIRGALPNGALGTQGGAGSSELAVGVVKLFLDRATQQVVMRRFRLPAFEGVEGFLRAYGKDKDIKTKKGKEAPLDTIARRILSELAASPGSASLPAAAQPSGTTATLLWPAHSSDSSARSALEAVMQAQAKELSARAPGPAAGALVIASAGFGPAVNLTSLIPSASANASADDLDMEDDDEDADDDDSAEGEEEEEGEDGEEADEECDMEGEESEEEAGDDEGMDQ